MFSRPVIAPVVAFAVAPLAGLCAMPCNAQNLGGVFAPMVAEGHKAAQYRAAYQPDTDQFANRFHYQEALNGDFMLRGVVATRQTPDADFDFDFVQAELFWDLGEDGQAWRSGFRLDARIRGDGRPGQLGLNWMNQFDLGDGWRSRFLVLTAVEIGDEARDGISLETRADVARQIGGGLTAGVELFSAYGSTTGFRDLDEQSHTLGPFVTAPILEDWSLFAGVLFGLTEASADQDVRLWITHRF